MGFGESERPGNLNLNIPATFILGELKINKKLSTPITLPAFKAMPQILTLLDNVYQVQQELRS
jgi:hypothetical protein